MKNLIEFIKGGAKIPYGVKVFNNESLLIQGDCLEVLPWLSENNIKVDLVLTDPPYG